MKHLAWFLVCGLFVMGCWLAMAADIPSSGGLPPLKVDKAAPLLLDDGPAKPEDKPNPKKPRADNSACFVCHGNFQDELMVTAHAKENISCAKCHGPSLAHRNDEDNVTPPDTMFSSGRIDKSCRQCHEDHNASARKVIKMFQTKFPSGTDPQQVLCTDCHGEHRLKVRSVWWDKDTGKLLKENLADAEKTGVGRKTHEKQ